MRREAPEPWATAMRRAGAVDPRNDNPSMSALGKMAGIHTTTISSMIFSDRDTEPEVIRAVAKALEVDLETVSKWTGRSRPVRSPYVPPPEADMLDERQRRAVSELIRSITIAAPREAEVIHHDFGRMAADRGQAGIDPDQLPDD